MSVAGTVGYNGFPFPIGAILPFITVASFPKEVDGWLLCDGRSLAVSEYPELYAVINNEYDVIPVDGEFGLPVLNVRGDSYLTGSQVTNGTKQASSVTFERTSGPTVISIENIPTITSGAGIDGEYTNTAGDVVKYTNSQVSVYNQTPENVCYYTSSGNTLNPTNTTTLKAVTLEYTNDVPTTIPDVEYTVTGAVNSEYYSICYFIKARYFSPPVIPPYNQTIPPNSGIYNDTDSLSGFLGPFPTYPTGF
jgi:microcystin-dependent protein